MILFRLFFDKFEYKRTVSSQFFIRLSTQISQGYISFKGVTMSGIFSRVKEDFGFAKEEEFQIVE
jgi:hypothetical protein